MPSNWYLWPASEGITRGPLRLYLKLEIISAAPENLLKFWIVKILGTYKVTETLFYVLLVNKRNYKVCTRGTNPNQGLEPIIAVLSACRFGAWGLSVRIATYPCSYWIFHLHHQASNLPARKREAEEEWRSFFLMSLMTDVISECSRAGRRRRHFFHYRNTFKTIWILHALFTVLAEKTSSKDDVKKQGCALHRNFRRELEGRRQSGRGCGPEMGTWHQGLLSALPAPCLVHLTFLSSFARRSPLLWTIRMWIVSGNKLKTNIENKLKSG